ncbi:lipopolysaccharide biosynthesis protein [Streptomyces afghaniensis]|uniref:lipopolysaccharide biosynthesis protein n=1 Tax=Streptomyces afghaniensis TaxID=66865 RepID=UPI003788B948
MRTRPDPGIAGSATEATSTPGAATGPPTRAAGRPWAATMRAGITAVLPRDPLLRNGHLLAVSSLANAALGAVFWICASRWYDDRVVGLSYSALSAVTLLASIGQLNLSDFLVRFVPSAGRHTRGLILTCYAAGTACSVAAAVVFLLLVPHITPDLDFLLTPANGICFVAATVGYAMFILQDGALTGVRRPRWVMAENLIFAVVRNVLLAIGAALSLFTGILISWGGAFVASFLLINLYLLRRAVPQHERTAPEAVRPTRMVGYAAADYAGSLFRMAAYTFAPLLVLNSLGAEQSAYFSLAWVVGFMLYLVTTNMGSSLIVEAVRSPGQLSTHTGRMLRHSALLLALAAGGTIVLAPQLLSFFGPDYAEHGATLLRLVALSALPNLVVSLAVDVARARRKMRMVVGLQLALCVLVVGLAAMLLPLLGLSGAGVAWLMAQCLLALYLLIWRSHWLPRGSEPTP